MRFFLLMTMTVTETEAYFLRWARPQNLPFLLLLSATMTFADPMICAGSSCGEDVIDLLTIMRRQEATTYRRTDYLAKSEFLRVVDAPWRQRIVEWMYGVVDHCSLRRDSVAIATYYLDLSVERGIVESREGFQLAAMCALQLAIKLYDSTSVKLDSMTKLGRGLFTEQDVIAMESKMLTALKWQVHPPSPVCFLRQFLRLLPPTVTPVARYMIAEVTRFISEISVCLYKFVTYPSSAVAYAGMQIAMDRIDESMLPIWQRQEIFRTMAHAVQLDAASPLMVEVTKKLEQSLEKNVCLQDLMKTIDAQCHETYSKIPTDYSSARTTPIQGMNSPRDVIGRHQ
jgi:hypothetical protein